MLHRVPGRIALLTIGLMVLTAAGLFASLSFDRERGRATAAELRDEKRLLVERIIELTAQPLRTLALDYTRWDDMVAFVEAPTPEWAAENVDAALGTYGADAIWVLRPDRTVAYAVTAEGREALASPPWPTATVPQPLSDGSPLMGWFTDSPLGLVELFGAPVQPDADLARTSEPRGYLFAGRVWDEDRLRRLRELAEAELTLEPGGTAAPGGPESPDRFERGLPGLDGAPAARLRVRVPARLLEELDRTAGRQLLLLVAGAGATVLFAVLALLWWVGRPVRILGRALHADDAAQLDRLKRDRSEFGEFAELLRQYFAQRTELQREVRERQVLQEHLEHLAHHDDLTGLPNRALLLDRLRLALARAERSGLPLAVALVDLDGFKPVNDSLGHEAGDALLREVAVRLLGLLRKSDTVARLGGDEFVLVLPDVGGVTGAGTVAQRVVAALGRPFDIKAQRVRIGASVGLALFPSDGADEETLLKAADSAMYAAKAAGKGRLAFASPASTVEAERRAALQRQVGEALAQGELSVVYEPVVELASGALAGARALPCWNAPQRAAAEPAELRAIIADSELAPEVGDFLLRTVCADLRQWLDAGLAPGTITLPLCARRLRRRDTVERVRQAVASMGRDVGRIELEVESETAATDVKSTAETLAQLRELGVRTSLGEYGAGRACLQLVRGLQLDGLRLGGAPVRELAGEPGSDALISALAALAERMGTLRLAADGVDDEERSRRLQRAGCRFGSGAWVGPPLEAAAFAELARAGRVAGGRPAVLPSTP
jgi:diguanylate cyclase (GGDEF)-like protein